MYIESIVLEHFRNMGRLELTPCQGINVIYGDNAQGKTNLAEAIWLFTGAKSFRGSKEKEMVQFGQEQATALLHLYGGGRSQQAKLRIGNQRQMELNEIALPSPAKMAGVFYSVVFSPVHLSLVKEGPALRRRFLDTALCQVVPKYGSYLREYHRVLDQRNALLKDLERFPQLEDTLVVWDQHFAKLAAAVLYCRFHYVKRMASKAKEVYLGISGQEEELELFMECSVPAQEDMSREQLRQQVLLTLKEKRREDIARGSTSAGPHRDDLEFLVNGVSAKAYGSQGQQRSCVLALKMAECAIIEEIAEESPVILLDDVMSELDSRRRSYLLNKIQGRQVFVTCCDQESVDLLEQGQAFYMERGCIIPKNTKTGQ